MAISTLNQTSKQQSSDLLIQFSLGMTNVWLRLRMWSRVLRLTVAAALWASLVLVWSLCYVRQPLSDR